jgi:hypothetical protein
MAWVRVSVEEDDSGFGAKSSEGDEENEDRQIKLIGKTVGRFDPAAVEVPEFYDIQLPQHLVSEQLLTGIEEVLLRHPGQQPVRLQLVEGENVVGSYLAQPKVEPSEALGVQLKAAVGA